MTPATTNNSQAIIKTFATASSTFELKTASSSMSIEMKINSEPKTYTHQRPTGSTSARPSAFVRRLGKWADEEYRQGYLEASIEQGVAWQIRANRKVRGLTQAELAKCLDTNQSAVSRLEDPAYGSHSLETLVKVAHVFDCALSVKFIPYSQFAEESVDLREENMIALSFNDEIRKLGERNAREPR
jgi:transcriptional regulator with XRE-family HTH domain